MSLCESLASPGAYIASTLGIMASSSSDPSVVNTTEYGGAKPESKASQNLLFDTQAALGVVGMMFPRVPPPFVRSSEAIVPTNNIKNNNNNSGGEVEMEEMSINKLVNEGDCRQSRPPPIHSKFHFINSFDSFCNISDSLLYGRSSNDATVGVKLPILGKILSRSSDIFKKCLISFGD